MKIMYKMLFVGVVQIFLIGVVFAPIVFGAQAPSQNPYTAPNGTATMHGDSSSSDTTPFNGPGIGAVTIKRHAKTAACPTILAGKDLIPVALVTTMFGREPVVHLIDPITGDSLVSLGLVKGSLFGGVYAFMDNKDRLVVVDGNQDLLKISHNKDSSGKWELKIEERINIADATGQEGVVGLVPDWKGRIWFATAKGTAGFVGDNGTVIKSLKLNPADAEGISNSISSCPSGVAIATSHALYLLNADENEDPLIRWRRDYDRGEARKPGQLSWGTGATPTFFGPVNGSEYVTITDNAFPLTHLLVYRTQNGDLISSVPIFGIQNSGTENSPIAYGRSIYVASTYGYPYPALPEGAGESKPKKASFIGGMQRIDVREDESGVDIIWTNTLRSTTVPRLSLRDNLLYTFSRYNPINHQEDGNSYFFNVIDPSTGKVLTSTKAGFGFMFDTLQMVGNIMPDGKLYQGVMTGILSVKAR